MMFNNSTTDPLCNGYCPRYTPGLAFGPHLGSPIGHPYRGTSSKIRDNPRCYSLLEKLELRACKVLLRRLSILVHLQAILYLALYLE